jgi:hypothetical protein
MGAGEPIVRSALRPPLRVRLSRAARFGNHVEHCLCSQLSNHLGLSADYTDRGGRLFASSKVDMFCHFLTKRDAAADEVSDFGLSLHEQENQQQRDISQAG